MLLSLWCLHNILPPRLFCDVFRIVKHSNSKVPIIIAVGKKESQEKTASVRRIGSTETKTFKLDEIVTNLSNEVKSPIE